MFKLTTPNGETVSDEDIVRLLDRAIQQVRDEGGGRVTFYLESSAAIALYNALAAADASDEWPPKPLDQDDVRIEATALAFGEVFVVYRGCEIRLGHESRCEAHPAPAVIKLLPIRAEVRYTPSNGGVEALLTAGGKDEHAPAAFHGDAAVIAWRAIRHVATLGRDLGILRAARLATAAGEAELAERILALHEQELPSPDALCDEVLRLIDESRRERGRKAPMDTDDAG